MTLIQIQRCLLVAAAVLGFAVGAAAQSEWTTGTISYDGLGNIVAMGQDLYVYDSAGRLVSGTANQQQSSATARQDYSYDAFGNRVMVTTSGTTCVGRCASNVTVSASTNQISDNNAAYDAAGHMKTFGAETYAYDGAEMVSRVTDAAIDWQFVYTADDERLATYTGQGNWRFTVRDLDHKVLREVTAYQGSSGTTWTWDRDHVYREGLLLATLYPSGQRQQFHLDHLGSARMVTDANGALIGLHAYYPFGDELALNSSEFLPERLKFTGHERDSLGSDEPLDYVHARFYTPVAGRFASLDPTPANPRLPQSWNRYTYVLNNPLNRTDPTGKILEYWGSSEEKTAEETLEDTGEVQNTPTDAQSPPYPEPRLPNGDLAPPPAPLRPGKGQPEGEENSWVYHPNDPDTQSGDRPGKWAPKYPIPNPKGSQPGASWDPEHGHWDVDRPLPTGGKGPRERYLEDGTPIGPDHKPLPSKSTIIDFFRPSNGITTMTKITTVVVVGVVTLQQEFWRRFLQAQNQSCGCQ